MQNNFGPDFLTQNLGNDDQDEDKDVVKTDFSKG